jgi:hypothetical protein
LAEALPELPDTAGELKAVAEKLGAPSSDIHLRRETRLRVSPPHQRRQAIVLALQPVVLDLARGTLSWALINGLDWCRWI